MTLSTALTTIQDKARQYISLVLILLVVLAVLSLRGCFVSTWSKVDVEGELMSDMIGQGSL